MSLTVYLSTGEPVSVYVLPTVYLSGKPIFVIIIFYLHESGVKGGGSQGQGKDQTPHHPHHPQIEGDGLEG